MLSGGVCPRQAATGARHRWHLVRAAGQLPGELRGEDNEPEEGEGDDIVSGGDAQHHGEGKREAAVSRMTRPFTDSNLYCVFAIDLYYMDCYLHARQR